MTTWADVAVVSVAGAIILGGLGIGAFLVTKGHPWFALLVFLIAGSVSVKTGKAAEGVDSRAAITPPAGEDAT